MTNDDATEIERFTIFLRVVGQAKKAGVGVVEAMNATYEDVYGPEKPTPHNPETCRDPACDCMPF